MKYTAHALCLLAGIGGGWALSRYDAAPAVTPDATPADWVARIGGDYLTPAMVEEEMRRRGGMRPGLFQDDDQKRALLDDMLLHRALVAAARDAGIEAQPETRRSIEQLLTSQYLQATLRKTQGAVNVSEAEVKTYFDKHAADFAVPARRRVAMLRFEVAPDATEETWEAAEKRAAEALAKARKLDKATLHFGTVAREFSEDVGSRYRGGVIGWLTDGRTDGYRWDRALLDAAYALDTPGDFSGVLRGKDGVYVARLVETQPEQQRSFEQLRAGLEQRLMQERLGQVEKAFREQTLAAAPIEVNESRLAAIQPPGPPASDAPPTPPAMPADAGAGK